MVSPKPDLLVESVLERLAALEAREEIREVIAAYSHGANKRDLTRFLGAFHPDGVWDVGSAAFAGHAETRQAILRQWNSQPGMHHWNSNTVVTLRGADEAYVLTDVWVLTEHSDGTRTLTAGTYEDNFTLKAQRWAIAERRASVHRTIEINASGTMDRGDGHD
ncbi:nuclear transport factor 2 family protein [Demequina flava]|uniref:nuclear transport factor 2 family protein n=1 Tax=Demequina flava TaxID=1095025 RepID=UPI000780412C|nr:nuclear transport factor 2 family protein [Demequina flava]